MFRRCVAILTVCALAAAFLPELVRDLSASDMPSCCNGVVCPMHHNWGQKISCDINLGHQGAELQACPSAYQHYATLLFVPIAPVALLVEWLVDSMPIFASSVVVSNTHEVLSPPPRRILP